MNKEKYKEIREKFEEITHKKADVDLLAALKTVLNEATEVDNTIKIIIDRNKQVLNIPVSLLKDYVDSRKSEMEGEVDALMNKVTIDGQ